MPALINTTIFSLILVPHASHKNSWRYDLRIIEVFNANPADVRCEFQSGINQRMF